MTYVLFSFRNAKVHIFVETSKQNKVTIDELRSFVDITDFYFSSLTVIYNLYVAV